MVSEVLSLQLSKFPLNELDGAEASPWLCPLMMCCGGQGSDLRTHGPGLMGPVLSFLPNVCGDGH